VYTFPRHHRRGRIEAPPPFREIMEGERVENIAHVAEVIRVPEAGSADRD
jgi:hypothetical protein